tara:strand:- start:60 stop:1079 length:1020 start_codon:yes stop_codon:yes gene_type:complete
MFSGVSVVIPCYNAQRSVQSCLESLSRFISSNDDEVIIVDDGSSDQTLAIASEYIKDKEKWQIIQNNINSGASVTRNNGAKTASKEIILFVDSDVIIVESFKSRLLDIFNEAEDIAGVQGIYDIHTPIDIFASKYKNLFYHYHHMLIAKREVEFTSTFFFAVRKKAFFKVGLFNETIKRASVEDGELGSDLVTQGNRIILEKSLRVQHLADYTFFTLMKRSFQNAAQKIRSILKKRKQLSVKYSQTEHPVNILIGIILGGCSLGALVLSLINKVFIWYFLFGVFAFFLASINQVYYVLKNKGLYFGIKYAAYLYCDLTVSFFGLIYGLVDLVYESIIRS